MHFLHQMLKTNVEFVDPVCGLLRWLHFGKLFSWFGFFFI